MDNFKVTIGGMEREKDGAGRFKCLECEEFKIKRKPGRPPNKYCKTCGKAKKAENLKKVVAAPKGKKKLVKKKVDLEEGIFGYVDAPGGDVFPVVSEQEKLFYEGRRDQLLKNYDFSGAELDLLKIFLQLTIEAKRLEKMSLWKNEPRLIKSLINISDAMVKVQQNLGITRDQRIDRTEDETVEGAIEKVIARFKKYRSDNMDRFVWKCKHCGSKNVETRENPDWEKIKKAENISALVSVTPIEGETNGT